MILFTILSKSKFPLPIFLYHHAEFIRHSSVVSVAAFVGAEDVEICCPKLLLFYYSSQLEELLRQSLPHRNTIRLPDHDPEIYLNLTFWMRNGNIDELKIRDPDADDGARHVICRSLVRLWVLVDAMKIKMPTHPSISDIRTQILDRFNDLLRTAKEITTLLSQDLLLEAHRTMQPTDTSLNQLWDLMISELFVRFMQSPRPNPDKYKTLFHQIPILHIELLRRLREYVSDSDPEDHTEVPLTRARKAIDLRPTHRFPDTRDSPFANAETQNELHGQGLLKYYIATVQAQGGIGSSRVSRSLENSSFFAHPRMQHDSLNENQSDTHAMTLQARRGSYPLPDAEMDDEHSTSDPVQQGGSPATSAPDYDAMSISESVDEETPGPGLSGVPFNSQEPPSGRDDERVQAIPHERTTNHDDTERGLSSLATGDVADGISNGTRVLPSLPPTGGVERGKKRKRSFSSEHATVRKRGKLG